MSHILDWGQRIGSGLDVLTLRYLQDSHITVSSRWPYIFTSREEKRGLAPEIQL